jgi:hypothetical protein
VKANWPKPEAINWHVGPEDQISTLVNAALSETQAKIPNDQMTGLTSTSAE